MSPMPVSLTIRAIYEMARYDLTNRLFGFNKVRNSLAKRRISPRRPAPELAGQVCRAVNLAACFYFKQVWCLQKSVVTARLLRHYGVEGRVVIGYRQAPFFSHAWVEADGRVLNDSSVYKQQLNVLSVI